jgi:hypothetical protein
MPCSTKPRRSVDASTRREFLARRVSTAKSIADNGSTDGSIAIAEARGARVARAGSRCGAAPLEGMQRRGTPSSSAT